MRVSHNLTNVSPAESAMIGCRGGCGAKWLAAEIEKSGWDRLELTGAYRCFSCTRALAAASTAVGTWPSDAADPLPATSIGALKKLPERPPLHEKVVAP